MEQQTVCVLLCFQLLIFIVSHAEELHIADEVVYTTDELFVGVTIDSGILKRHWDHFEPKSKKLQTLAAALSPCYLRVGGNDADFLIFQEDSTREKSSASQGKDSRLIWTKHKVYNERFDIPQRKWHSRKDLIAFSEQDYNEEEAQRKNFTMSAELYDQLHGFVEAVDWSLIFDLNVLLRKGGSWDPTNAQQLMEYTLRKGYKMAGWELGNEPNIINHLINVTLIPEQLEKDYQVFQQLIASFPAFTSTYIVGPSVTRLQGKATIDYFKRFMNSGGGHIVTAASFHQYYLASSEATVAKFTDPAVLNVLYSEVSYGVNLTRASGSTARVWVGETSSSYGGGAPGLSDAYVAAFMWLDKLGICAAGRVDVVLRQSFYGYNYSLIDNLNFDPHPDYWLTLLYKQLVGNKVLKVIWPSNRGHLRAYAHCTATKRSGYQAGSIVVYVLNLYKTDQVLTFPKLSNNGTVNVYSMEPLNGDLKSKTVLLNGVPLKMINNSTLPVLQPVQTKLPVTIKAMTYSFLVFPGANFKVCM